MAWDTAKTREGLLAAATIEFARAGYSGARVDAVAAAAGTNKERIYQYFGNKQGLFDAALERELGGLLESSEITGVGPDAVGEYAGCLFDAYALSPWLPRLLAWEGLERAHPVATQERLAGCARERAALRLALPGVGEEAAGQLLLTIVSVVTAWFVLPQLPAVVLGGTAPDGAAEVEGDSAFDVGNPVSAARRSAIATQMAAIAGALSSG